MDTGLVLESSSPEETVRLGVCLGELLAAGDVIALSGDLGAGKTKFTQGIAAGLDVPDAVTSPTFTIHHAHVGRIPLHHLDFYRLEAPEELSELGLEELLYADGACVIEWGGKFPSIYNLGRLDVDLRITGGNRRRLAVRATEGRFEDLAREWIGRC